MEPEVVLPGLDFAPDEMYVLQSMEELRTLANPLRIQILDRLIEAPRTVRDIGAMLGINSTKLYYHVGELEKVGLVRLVHTEVQSGIQLKYYRAAALYYHVTPAMLHLDGDRKGPSAGAEYLASAVEIGAHELRRSMADGTIAEHDEAFIVSRRTMRMSPAAAERFRERLTEIDLEFRRLEEPEGDLAVELVFALFPRRGDSDGA
ncbi:MAG TPA: winged helix-turn-helix domain-containing protein [Thermomicrobiaceae bacterium]|nr:winged helix-turn-helix domain-containing protein [Thermomicrobiaceae bacterium]